MIERTWEKSNVWATLHCWNWLRWLHSEKFAHLVKVFSFHRFCQICTTRKIASDDTTLSMFAFFGIDHAHSKSKSLVCLLSWSLVKDEDARFKTCNQLPMVSILMEFGYNCRTNNVTLQKIGKQQWESKTCWVHIQIEVLDIFRCI